MKNKGFTLIELLAVIVILAIIALIATPIVLNIINDSKKESAKRSMDNYIHAVELAIVNKNFESKTKNLDGKYYIKENGKILVSDDNTIEVEFEGQELTVNEDTENIAENSFMVIEDGKVKKIKNTKMDKWYAYMVLGELKLFDRLPESKIKGQTYLKDEMLKFGDITTIEFLSWGQLPEGYTLEELKDIPNKADVSENEDYSVVAYYDSGNVYVYSEDLIVFGSSLSFFGLNSLTNIEFGDIDTSVLNSMNVMFQGCSSLTKLNLSSFDTQKVNSMQSAFMNCSSLTNIEFGNNFDTSNVGNLIQTFFGCRSLTGLDLSMFDTSKITNMWRTFHGCSSLTELDLSGFNTSSVTNMSEMFQGCSSLTELDLSGFNTSSVTNMSKMFWGCSGLTELDLRNFDTSAVTNKNAMFYGTRELKEILVSEGKWTIIEESGDVMFAGSGVSAVTYK